MLNGEPNFLAKLYLYAESTCVEIARTATSAGYWLARDVKGATRTSAMRSICWGGVAEELSSWCNESDVSWKSCESHRYSLAESNAVNNFRWQRFECNHCQSALDSHDSNDKVIVKVTLTLRTSVCSHHIRSHRWRPLPCDIPFKQALQITKMIAMRSNNYGEFLKRFIQMDEEIYFKLPPRRKEGCTHLRSKWLQVCSPSHDFPTQVE